MLSEIVKSADWKTEKHVPAITTRGTPAHGETFEATVAVGAEIPHPNTPEHHIAWIALYFVPEGSSTPVELARAEFRAHGGNAAVAPVLKAALTLSGPGTLLAASYCNLHGLWESSLPVA